MSGKPVGPASVQVVTDADVVLVSVSGLIDERFKGFGSVGAPTSIVLDVSGITRMTSFGVRQWLLAMDALPKQSTEQFLLGCPTFFVDQLNMVLNFGGSAKVITVVAPHTCTACGVESGEIIDVFAERTNLANGATPERKCQRCGGLLEFDESPESYFSFVNKYQATSIEPRTAAVLAARGLYTAVESDAEKPPRIIKLVQDSVTYFRIIGRIGAMFRARPLLVGAEGEVVLDLSEVDTFEAAGSQEWRRLIKNLSGQASAITLVDVRDTILEQIVGTLTGDNIVVASVIATRKCTLCEQLTFTPETLGSGPFADRECGLCGEIARTQISEATFATFDKLNTTPPRASAGVIGVRAELIARALKEAAVQPGDPGNVGVGGDDSILGKYKIVRRLPSGSGVDVFLAKQVGIGGFEKPVVLKKIEPKLLEARQRSVADVLEELKLVGRLMQPNIAQVLDIGEVAGTLYIAIEYVNGKSLFEIVEQLKQPMPLPEALHVAREIALALDHAYNATDMAGNELRVLHGDLRPHNVLLTTDGAVKVVDFGVVMASITANADSQYTAPEALEGPIQNRSDLFSLGVLLYMMCSGQHPFPRVTGKTSKKKTRLRPLEELVSVPVELANLVGQLLSTDPAQRPQRSEVLAELTRLARGPGLESSSQKVGAMVARVFPAEPSAPSRPTPVPKRSPSIHGAPLDGPLKIDESVAIVPQQMQPATDADAAGASSSMWKLALILEVIVATALVIYLVGRC